MLVIDLLGDRDPLIRAAALQVRGDGRARRVRHDSVEPRSRSRLARARLAGVAARHAAAAERAAAADVDAVRRRSARDRRRLDVAREAERATVGDILLDHLKSDDPVVGRRRRAASASCACRPARRRSPAAYQFALRDTTYVARAALIEAFSKYGASASRSLLDVALGDKDWAVRVRAAAAAAAAEPQTDAPRGSARRRLG